MNRAVLGFVLCLVSIPAAAQIRVAVETGGSSTASGAAVAAQLNDDTFFNFSATVVSASQIDTVAALRSGQGDQLLEQAVAWAASVTAPRAAAPTVTYSGLAMLATGLALMGVALLRWRA